jgi:hypothetical protein
MMKAVTDNTEALVVLHEPRAHLVARWLVAYCRDIIKDRQVNYLEAVGVEQDLVSIRAYGSGQSTALIAMGDGSACRSVKAPGYLDERSFAFDDASAVALASADSRWLRTLDCEIAAELMVAGRHTWPSVGHFVDSDYRQWTGTMLANSDPYGVSYFVAYWLANND